MSEPRGTQIKNLPRVNTLDGSDVIVKQKTLPDNAQTQGIRVSDVMNYTRQQLSIPQILQDITDIQQQITTIIQKSDVADIVNCYDNEGDTSKTDIVHYDTTTLSNNDIIEVLDDETHSNSVSYYKYNSSTGTFTYIGSLSPYYNKTEIDDKLLLINNDLLKLFSYGNFAPWDATKTYSLYAIVLKNNLYWRSLQNNNTNHDPEEVNSQYWELFKLGGGGGSARIGQLEFYYAPLVFADNEVLDRIEFNGQEVPMSSYPEFKFWLKQHPEFFVSSKAQYDAIKDASATGQVGYFCWKDNTEQEVYMPIINDITFLQSLPIGAIQKQEVPTWSLSNSQYSLFWTGLNITPSGAITHSGSKPHASTEAAGSSPNTLSYNPYDAGDTSFVQNGKNVRQEAIRVYIYIVAIQGDTQTNFFFKTKAPVQDYSYLPTAEQGTQEQDARKCVNSTTIDNVLYPSGMYVYIDGSWQLYGDGKTIIHNPFSLGMMQRSNTPIVNASWLKSDATAKDGTIYQSMYDKLLDVNTTGTSGTITIRGNTYNTKEKDGFVVISATDWQTIYSNYGIVAQFGIDTTNQQFYLPYGNESKRVLVEKKEETSTDSSWYNLYSDGWVEQGGRVVGRTSGGGAFHKTATLPFQMKTDKYNISANAYRNDDFVSYDAMYYGISIFSTSTNIRFRTIGVNGNQYIDGVIWEAKGYTNQTTALSINYYDYYYVGATIQNAGIINIGNLLNKINNALYIVKEYHSATYNYEVYSNGTCEQWGYKTYPSNESNTTIALEIPYIDTTYVPLVCYAGNNSIGSENELCVMENNKQTTSFEVRHGAAFSLGLYWRTKGRVDLSMLNYE